MDVGNIPNEVGLRQECFFFCFAVLEHTPILAETAFKPLSVHVHPTGSAHLFHRFGVTHQTSLRSFQTMMSSSNFPLFRGGG